MKMSASVYTSLTPREKNVGFDSLELYRYYILFEAVISCVIRFDVCLNVL